MQYLVLLRRRALSAIFWVADANTVLVTKGGLRGGAYRSACFRLEFLTCACLAGDTRRLFAGRS
ncbi:hypothetical protein MHPYR_440050 [uncultured Mycobacterium sp.]|uniref:Uncharacterized protein n=1 Tax=uncultured Mycobacterium sp. TaxID=171292 RepID=A0A1Y5PNS4_9MYCO|nr:hypothetical protein MHPYR_440050 [uncultured Mycobacterium sp.]